MALEIREMELKDFMSVIALVKRELMCRDNSSDIYDRLMRIYRNDAYETLVADLDGAVIGFVGTMRGLAFEQDGEYVRVIALAVRREYQGNGIGSRLVGSVEDRALESDTIGIVISSGLRRTNAHAFYGGLGYEKRGFSFIKMLPVRRKESYDDLFAPIPHREGGEAEEEAF